MKKVAKVKVDKIIKDEIVKEEVVEKKVSRSRTEDTLSKQKQIAVKTKTDCAVKVNNMEWEFEAGIEQKVPLTVAKILNHAGKINMKLER